MTKSQRYELDDLRKFVNPDAYRAQLQEAVTTLDQRLAGLFVELDLVKDNPELKENIREKACENLEGQIKDLGWRRQRAQDKLDGLAKAEQELVQG